MTTRNKLLVPLSILILAWAWIPATLAQPHPSTGVLVPCFEVDLFDPGRSTNFSFVTDATHEMPFQVRVWTNWGIPVLETSPVVGPNAVFSASLRDWLVHGKLPDRTLSPEELAHVQAALSGNPSPRDGLYYSSATAPDQLAGYVTIDEPWPASDECLWGDYEILDPSQNFGQGETLVNLDRDVNAYPLCRRTSIRYMWHPEMRLTTDLVIWTAHRGIPRALPEPAKKGRVPLTILVFNEAGRLLDQHELEVLPVSSLDIEDLLPAEPFGWLEFWSPKELFITGHYSLRDTTSLALHGYCLPEEVGPPDRAAVEIEKLVDGRDADEPPGLRVPVGTPLEWTFVITNTGNVDLTELIVTDDQGLEALCPPRRNPLAPGESFTCTARSQALACQHRNVAEVRGLAPDGSLVADTDPAFYFGTAETGLSLEKHTQGEDADAPPGPAIAVGERVQWTYRVTNTGQASLTDVVVTDDQGLAVTCPQQELATGETMVCTASAMAVIGPYANLGQAVALGPCGEELAASDPSHYTGISDDDEPQGCTPGYWKNHPGAWEVARHDPGQTVASVFAQAATYPDLASATLLEALDFGGGAGALGGAKILLRAAVAAALNAAHPGVEYPLAETDVIARVDSALASQDRDTLLLLATALDAHNNLGCPLS